VVLLWPGLVEAGRPLAEREAGKRAEALGLIDALLTGQLQPAALANRVKFLGQEAAASDALGRYGGNLTDLARRRDVYQALALLAHPAALGALERGLSDEDGTVRMLAVQGLGKIGNPRSAPKLVALLNDKTVGVRREAARTIGMFRQPVWSKTLVGAAKAEGEIEVRVAMLVAVGMSGDLKQERALEGFLKSSSEATRLGAARGLCLLGSPKGLSVAKGQLSSLQPSERLRGVLLLEGAAPKLNKKLLMPLLADTDKAVAAKAARVLYQGGEEAMLAWLVVQSFQAQGDDKNKLELELEELRLTSEQREMILTKAGLK
jgi:HEAT repeat protein